MITSLSLVNVLTFIISLSFVAAMMPPQVLEVPTENGRRYEKYCQLTPLTKEIPESYKFGEMEDGDSVVIPELLYGAMVDDATLKGNGVGAAWLAERAARKGKSMKDEWIHFLRLFNFNADVYLRSRGSEDMHMDKLQMKLNGFFRMVYGHHAPQDESGYPRHTPWGSTVVKPKAGVQLCAEDFYRQYPAVQGPAVPTQNAALYHKYVMLASRVNDVHIPQLLYGGMLDDAGFKGNPIGREWLATRASQRRMSMEDEWIEFLSCFNGRDEYDGYATRGSFNHNFKRKYSMDMPQELDDFFKMVYGKTILATLNPDLQRLLDELV